MIYGYVRVSTINQNIDRQIEELYKLGITDKFIYVDYESGKDFDRKNYQKLIKKIKKDDLIIIKSIDRLGRNYDMIIEEWKRITIEKDADIQVLDMPLLDTRIKGDNLVGKFISDLVLQVLSFVAQNERENIKARQAEGIRIAKAKGVKFGRPKIVFSNNYASIFDNYKGRKITITEACEQLNVKRSTFYKYLKMYNTNLL